MVYNLWMVLAEEPRAFARQRGACLTSEMLSQVNQCSIYMFTTSCLIVLFFRCRKVQKKKKVSMGIPCSHCASNRDSGLTKSEGFTSGDGQARSVQLSNWLVFLATSLVSVCLLWYITDCCLSLSLLGGSGDVLQGLLAGVGS